MKMITPVQCKMARAALNWGVRELADFAKINKATVSSFENNKGGTIATMEKIYDAFSGQNIKFIENGVIYEG